MAIEANLNKSFPSDRKYSFSERSGSVIKQYSEEYATKYHEHLNGMVERQMRASIIALGSFWYSAWVDAGQPDLNRLNSNILAKEESSQIEKEDKLFNAGKIIGREDE